MTAEEDRVVDRRAARQPCSAGEGAKAGSYSSSALAVTTSSRMPLLSAARLTWSMMRSVEAFFGLTSIAVTDACGTSSESSSSRFGFSSLVRS